MSDEGTPVKAPPSTRRRMKASGKRIWRHREVSGVLVKEPVIARIENYLDNSDNMKKGN